MCLIKNTTVYLVILGVVLFASTALQADQTAEKWVARYNGPGNDEDAAEAVAMDNWGNIYVTGSSVGSGTGNDYTTIKYEPNGTQKWIARYNGPANGQDYPKAIAVDNLGNVYVTGQSSNGTNYDFATIKYDPNGTQKWVMRYNGLGNSEDYANAMAVDSSGNVYVTGSSNNINYDYATIKYNTNGTTKWGRLYNGPGNGYDSAEAIAVDSSGNTYITGYIWSSALEYDYGTIKYDTNGNLKWAADYNGPANNNDYAKAIAADSGGNVYVTGYSLGSGTSYDYATIKYDPNGSRKWAARYDGPANQDDKAEDMIISGGNIYITGRSYDSNTNYDYATIKYEPNGNEKWVARYNGPGNNIDLAHTITADSFSNIYITGESRTGTNYNYTTIKYDSNGTQKWIADYNGPAGGYDYGYAIIADSQGNVYVTGSSTGSDSSLDYATIKYSQHDYCIAAPTGDLTGDCKVNFEDYAALADNWLDTSNWNDLATLTENWLECNFSIQEDCYSQMNLVPPCIGHWKMNDNAANKTVLDSSTAGHNGTAYHNTEDMNTIGITNGALNFNGTNDYVALSPTILGTGSYTKAAWVKLEASTTTFGQNIFTGSSQAFWAPYTYSNKLSTGHNGIWNQVQDNNSLSVGVWYFVAVAYNAGNNTLTLYKNGSFVATGNTTTPNPLTEISIGRFNSTATYFKGVIDNVMLFNRPLTANEIAALYNGGSGTEVLPAP